eukprot:6163363-Amphidinium_carterae.1
MEPVHRRKEVEGADGSYGTYAGIADGWFTVGLLFVYIPALAFVTAQRARSVVCARMVSGVWLPPLLISWLVWVNGQCTWWLVVRAIRGGNPTAKFVCS